MEDVERAFAVFDKEGKGHIPTDELKHMMTKIGQRSSRPELNRARRRCILFRPATHSFPSPHFYHYKYQARPSARRRWMRWCGNWTLTVLAQLT